VRFNGTQSVPYGCCVTEEAQIDRILGESIEEILR
jgi:hypothetical protein